MASSDRLTRLTNIRDQLEKELENETLRRLNLTVAGDPPPTTYSVDGQNLDWNGYLDVMLRKIKEINDMLSGSEDLYEFHVHGYV